MDVLLKNIAHCKIKSIVVNFLPLLKLDSKYVFKTDVKKKLYLKSQFNRFQISLLENNDK